ncbi:MAG: hypothetical protein ABI779_19065 [Acidobacteriota bacterium]
MDLEEDEDGMVSTKVYLSEFVRDICGKWVPDPYAELPRPVDGAGELSDAIHALRILASVLVHQRDTVESALEDLIFWESEGSKEETLQSVIERLEETQYVRVVIADGTPPS